MKSSAVSGSCGQMVSSEKKAVRLKAGMECESEEARVLSEHNALGQV